MKRIFIKDWEKFNFCKRAWLLRKYSVFHHNVYAVALGKGAYEPVFYVEMQSGKNIGTSMINNMLTKRKLENIISRLLNKYKRDDEAPEEYFNRRCREAELDFLWRKENKYRSKKQDRQERQQDSRGEKK